MAPSGASKSHCKYNNLTMPQACVVCARPRGMFPPGPLRGAALSSNASDRIRRGGAHPLGAPLHRRSALAARPDQPGDRAEHRDRCQRPRAGLKEGKDELRHRSGALVAGRFRSPMIGVVHFRQTVEGGHHSTYHWVTIQSAESMRSTTRRPDCQACQTMLTRSPFRPTACGSMRYAQWPSRRRQPRHRAQGCRALPERRLTT